jgi:hypothetical protein
MFTFRWERCTLPLYDLISGWCMNHFARCNILDMLRIVSMKDGGNQILGSRRRVVKSPQGKRAVIEKKVDETLRICDWQWTAGVNYLTILADYCDGIRGRIHIEVRGRNVGIEVQPTRGISELIRRRIAWEPLWSDLFPSKMFGCRFETLG